jgi:hypothetical protein
MKYLVYRTWEPKEGEQIKWLIMPNYTETMLNAEKPWLCFEQGKGLTGLVGMQLDANNEEDAKIKMNEVIEDYKKRDKEPNVWY